MVQMQNGRFTESHAVTVGQPMLHMFGECSYTALPVEIASLAVDEPMLLEQLLYLPDLGTGVLVRSAGSSGDIEHVFVNIAAEAP